MAKERVAIFTLTAEQARRELRAARTAVPQPEADRLLRVREVMKMTGLGRTTIWKLEREGTFPKRQKITGPNGRAVAWKASAVVDWIARCYSGGRAERGQRGRPG